MLRKALSKGEREWLSKLLTRQEITVRQALATYIDENTSDVMQRRVISYLEENRIGELMTEVDQSIVRLGNVIPKVFNDVAHATVENIGAKIGQASHISISFNPANERAANLMRGSQLEFIKDFTDGQRSATRKALTDAFQSGKGTQATANAFKESIGLTEYQMNAVDNYRDALERGSSMALDRVLRDRRFDSTVQSSIDDGDPLSSDQIDRMVERYQSRMLDYRSENIARTESLRVASEARHEATQQMLDDTGISPDLVERTWMATNDNRTRDSHAEMDGQTVGMDEPFITPDGDELMYPGDPDGPPEEVINCRCTVGISIKDEEANAEAA